MKLLACSLLCSLLVLPPPVSAHGGQWRGPGDTVPPGGGGAAGGGGALGPGGPNGPNSGAGSAGTPRVAGPGAGGAQPGSALTGAGLDGGTDLTLWSFWWELNKEPYLNLKAHVHAAEIRTASLEWFRGDAATTGRDSLEPSEAQVRDEIVPALLRALERENDNDIVTACLIALAKIGDGSSENGASSFEPILCRHLADKNQEVSETAAVALGILAHPQSIATLQRLLEDSAAGRALVERSEVSYRTRAFAAYGLGLIGSKTGREEDRRAIVSILARTLATEDTKTRDLAVSCILALGLVRLESLEPIEPGASSDAASAAKRPESSRPAQLDFLLALLEDGERNHLVRAHCPLALARLLPGLPEPHFRSYRERIAAALSARITEKKESFEVVQSSILALGLIGTNDGADPIDRDIRVLLRSVQENVADQQARNFALIALAKVGGQPGAVNPNAGIDEAGKALRSRLADGKNASRAWAGLAAGVLARKLLDHAILTPASSELQLAVRSALERENNPSNVGAFAIAAGIMGDVEATPHLIRRLQRETQDDARGYVAVALGLMDAHDAVAPIQTIVDESKYRPDLLRQAAIALGLLGDKNVVPKLIELLSNAKGLATQASISSALGAIGDRRSIEPLVRMLENEELTGSARGFAAVALGIVADPDPLPWNTKIGLDLNYRASTSTLTDHASGTGILDIL